MTATRGASVSTYNGRMPDDPAAATDPLDDILVCPLTRSTLRREGDYLVASEPEGAGLRYPIRDGIPILLIDQAELPEGVATLDDFKQRYAQYIPE